MYVYTAEATAALPARVFVVDDTRDETVYEFLVEEDETADDDAPQALSFVQAFRVGAGPGVEDPERPTDEVRELLERVGYVFPECDGGVDCRQAAGAPAGTPRSTPATLTLTPPASIWDRLVLEAGDGESVEEWVLEAIRMRFARIDAELAQTVDVDVDVPDAIAERVALRAAAVREQGGEPDAESILYDYVTFDPEFHGAECVGGDGG